ncbi:MAG: hydrogenase maturation protease [bacterium]
MLDYYEKRVLILGCGNILFGDDGFGPAVIEYLQKHYDLPQDVAVIDVGSGVRGVLFNLLLSEIKPQKIIIVDAIDTGRKPGEVFEVAIEDLPKNKVDDFSMHQLPTSNLLRELKVLGQVEVKLIAAQVENIPEMVQPGLSKRLSEAIPIACEIIMSDLSDRSDKSD